MQVVAQPLGFFLIEVERADLGHHHERTLEEFRVGEPHEEVIWFAVGVEAHATSGELGQSDGEIDVGLRVIDRPGAAAPALKGDAAEMKSAVEVSGVRGTHAAEAAAATAALRLAVAGGSDQRDDQQPQDDAGARHPLSLRQGPSLWSL